MKKILIVEDDVQLRQIYHTMLTGDGYEVEQVSTGQEGLTKAMAAVPDLILLDIMLPGGMNGFDLLEQLKRNPATQNIPVIVLTNLDNAKATALSIGATDYIVKTSTSIEDVVKKIKEHLKEGLPG